MLALNNLSKYENEKTTKILKPWFNVFSDYLVILLLTVSIFVGGMELASGRYVCVPAVDCSMSNNASTLLSRIKHHNVCKVFYSSQKSTDTKGKAITVVTKLKYTRDYDYVNSECEKTAFPWFHSYFSLLLFGQAFILLLVNNLWLKYPWTASFVNSFYALAEECYKLPGTHFAKLIENEQEPLTAATITTELISPTQQAEAVELLTSNDNQQNSCQGEDTVDIDLATAVAVKMLCEKIRRFDDYLKKSQQIQYVYLFQGLFQAILTITFLSVNAALFKDIKGTAKCSVDKYFPVIYDYFACSHNLSTLLEIALVLFLCILAVLFIFCTIIVSWTIYKVFWVRKYYFKNELKGWRMPSDLTEEERDFDMGFLLHLLHAYNKLYSVQFAIYMSKDHNRKCKGVILDNEWPVEKLDRCFSKDPQGHPQVLCLRGLSGIPTALFQFGPTIFENLQCIELNGCGPLQSSDFDEFGKFRRLVTAIFPNCGLTKIPENLYKLKKLICLDLSNNFIKEIEGKIRSLEALEKINISCNKLITIDRSIGTLPSLIRVNISNNPNISLSAINNVLACEKLEKLIVSNFSNILPLLPTKDARQKFRTVANEDQKVKWLFRKEERS